MAGREAAGSPAKTEENKVIRKEAANIKEFLAAPAIQKRVNEMLGKRSSQFVTSVISMAGQDNKLAIAEPRSLFNAALTAASLDLPINKNLGFAHIIPYENKRAGLTEAQFQMGWKGFVQLAQRTGQYAKINAVEVYEGQLIKQDALSGNTYDWQGRTSDKVIGYVAFFKLVNGFEHEVYMSVAEAEAHGKRYSFAYSKGYESPWKDNFDAMARKTVIKQLLSKWGPLSIEMQTAVQFDQAVIRDGDKPDYIDGNDMLADEVKADDGQKRAIIEANTDKKTGEIKEDQ